MKYQIRNSHLPYLEVNNIIDEFSFVRNHPIKQKDLTPRLQTRHNSGQLSSSDQTRSSQNKYRQSMQAKKSYLVEKQKFDRSKGLRQSANERKQNEQNYQHLYQRQSTNESSNPPTQVLKHQDLRQSGERIYQEIIRVLQMENANLKEQNQYFIHEHKRILKENSNLRAQVEELKGINGLHIQIKKLKDINQAYQNQVEELKFILLQEIVAIHQKFNMYMSQEQASLIYNELNDSIKISTSRINTDRFTFFDQKQRKDDRTPSTRTNSGMILAEMLEINQSEIFEKSPGKTAQTLDKENILNYSNFDLKFNDSPTQTTFSGHLRISN